MAECKNEIPVTKMPNCESGRFHFIIRIFLGYYVYFLLFFVLTLTWIQKDMFFVE